MNYRINVPLSLFDTTETIAFIRKSSNFLALQKLQQLTRLENYSRHGSYAVFFSPNRDRALYRIPTIKFISLLFYLYRCSFFPLAFAIKQ